MTRSSAFLACLALAGLAQADETATQMRQALEAHRASLVRVEATTFLDVEGVPGLSKGTRRSHRISTPGVVVDGAGLVLFPAQALDPAGEVFAMLGASAQADVLSVDVVGADGRVRKAVWLGRAGALACARVSESGREGLSPVAWAKALPEVGDPLLVLSLGDPALGRPASVEQARVAFRSEQALGLTPRLPHALGALVVAGGKPVGLLGTPDLPTGGDMLRPDLLASARAGYLIPAARLEPVIAAPPRETPAGAARPRAWLGAKLAQVTQALVEERKLQVDVGVVILEVYEGGPAAGAGLKENDVLLEMDGLPLDLDPGEQLEDLILDYRPGEVVPFKFQRAGKVQAVEVTLAEGPVTPRRAERASLTEVGLLVRELTFFDRKRLGLATDAPGVVVVELASDGAASRAGLRPDDVLLAIEDQPVGGLQDARERLCAPGTHSLKLRRRDQELTLRIRN